MEETMGLKVLQVAGEVYPFAKTGGLADVVGALPKSLKRLGQDVRVVMPQYQQVTEEKFPSTPVASDLFVPLGGEYKSVTIRQWTGSREVPTYFVESPEFFDRAQLYGHADDPQRFMTFARAALEMTKALKWQPDVIHCHDWHAGLIPVYVKTLYAQDFPKTATVFTIHNLAYQGVFPRDVYGLTGLDWSLFNYKQLEFYDQLNFLKAGLVFADVLNTVSEKYAEEIQTSEYGERLEGLLRERRERLFGVLNGIDYAEWSPAVDAHIAEKYSDKDMTGKAENKRALKERCGLKSTGRKRVPLIGVVSRLSGQKGFDLVAEAIDDIMSLDVQVVVLGAGDDYYTNLFRNIGSRYAGSVSVNFRFDEQLAHQIYAGCDLFLMPSRYEPCGLGQLISLKYGAIPIVRSTGGLADTIQDFDAKAGKGNGFSFEEYSARALSDTVQRAVKTYRTLTAWRKVVQNAVACDFSWDASAQKYADLYSKSLTFLPS
jgi:starch synthase